MRPLNVMALLFWLSSQCLAIKYLPQRPFPGSPILLKDIPEDVKEIEFLGYKFIPFTFLGHRTALLAVPLRTRPGVYKIYLKGEKITPLELHIYSKEYPEEHLSVPERMVTYPPGVLLRIKREIKYIREAVSGYTPELYLDGQFIWPAKGRISSPFGLRRFFNGQPRSPHSGLDIAVPIGYPIKAANSGRVVLLGNFYLPGKILVLDHGFGIYTVYAHLSAFCVKKGQMVKKGQIIALSGRTGRATGPHLHFGCYIEGIKIDPETLLILLGQR